MQHPPANARSALLELGPEVALLDSQGQDSLVLANNGDLQCKYERHQLLYTDQAYRRLVKAGGKRKFLDRIEALSGLLILSKVMELRQGAEVLGLVIVARFDIGRGAVHALVGVVPQGLKLRIKVMDGRNSVVAVAAHSDTMRKK